jgi:hypothetical protein
MDNEERQTPQSAVTADDPVTIPVRIRVVVYPLHHKPGEYGWHCGSETGYEDCGSADNVLWIEANIPVRPTPIIASVQTAGDVAWSFSDIEAALRHG